MTRWKTSVPASFEELTSFTFTIDNCLRQREAEKNYKAHKAPASSPLLSVPTPPTHLFSHQWSPCRVGACGWPWRRGKGVWAHCFTAPLRAFSRLSYWSFFFHNMVKLVSDHLNSTDKYLLKVMSAANKKAITKCWLQKCPLTGILFICVMKQLHTLEQMTCAIRLQDPGRKCGRNGVIVWLLKQTRWDCTVGSCNFASNFYCKSNYCTWFC